MNSEVLAIGALFGLVHAAHCAGMCGVFALGAARGTRPLAGLLLYLLGKTFTYVFLGAVAARLGGALGGLSSDVPRVLAWAVGGVLVFAGLRRVVSPLGRPTTVGAALARHLGPLVRAGAEVPGALRPFALGAATGAIPCGVVYLALLSAVALPDAGAGAAYMAAFGAGTAPVLIATGLLGRGALQRFGSRPGLLRLAGMAVLAAGLLTIARAGVDGGARGSSHDGSDTGTECPLCGS
ncbi:MAG: sulfite exporter TauE/SafE family protein [Planctomycetes bacterium]|nr:sulfite exporter TauE/SafE family protein [Planctomycetota bacterium]